MTNRKNLKAYVRYDNNGKAIAGSLIFRTSIPKGGKWREMDEYECCNQDQIPIVVNVNSLPFIQPDFVVADAMGNNTYFFMQGPVIETVNNVTELAAYNNTHFNGVGHFTVSGTDLIFTPTPEIAKTFVLLGITELSAFSFPQDF